MLYFYTPEKRQKTKKWSNTLKQLFAAVDKWFECH